MNHELQTGRYIEQGAENAALCAALDRYASQPGLSPSWAGEVLRRYTLRGKIDALQEPTWFEEDAAVTRAMRESYLISAEEAFERLFQLGVVFEANRRFEEESDVILPTGGRTAYRVFRGVAAQLPRRPWW